jgi:HSP20 family molecular chaperone IbpA
MKERGPLDGLTGLEALAEISKRLGQLPDAVRDAMQTGQSGESGEASRSHEFTINTPGGPLKGMVSTGFRTGSLAGGGQRRGPPGATARPRSRPATPDVQGAREPLIDCFDEGVDIVITAELPGVRADELDFKIDGALFVIRTTGTRRYHAAIDLPAPVVGASLVPELRNGILSVRIRKAAA